jgi:molecular chaperone DnaJ
MAKRDFYEILGVPRDADSAALKSAFRKQAKKYHPDQNQDNPDAEAKFKDLNEASDALQDPQSRAAYDRFGHQAFENGSPGGPGGPGGPGFGQDFASSMSDIFDDLFGEFVGGQRGGGGRRGGGRTRGADLRYNMEISLDEAHEGKTAQIKVPTAVSCETCSGSGAKPGTSPSTCGMCHGAGKVRASQGFFTVERTCPTCGGRGEVIQDPCDTCNGAGRTEKERTLQVNIPSGVEDGTRIRLSNEGEAGARGGPPGDLYIFLSIKPHPFFQRDGADLFCRVPISMPTAALGGEIEVPSLKGARVKVKVPEGTQSGKQFRLKGKGMPVLRSSQHGDLYIQVNVETPMNLTKKQKKLLEEFQGESTDKTSPESEGFFSRVKEFLNGAAN